VFEIRVMRGTFGPKRDEVTRDCRKLHNEKLLNLYSSPSIISMIKSRRIRWAEHIARIGRKATHIGYWWQSQKERDPLEGQDVGCWIIFRWILGEMGWNTVYWIGLAQETVEGSFECGDEPLDCTKCWEILE
jgi:hypothetical protein